MAAQQTAPNPAGEHEPQVCAGQEPQPAAGAGERWAQGSPQEQAERAAMMVEEAEALGASAEQLDARVARDDYDELVAEANGAFRSKVGPGKKAAIGAALVVIIVASLCLGRYSCNPLDLFGTIYHVLFDPNSEWDKNLITAIFQIRIPRVLCVVLVGAALSVAGASYQGMFKNPLVSPDLLGASAGASLGACIAILLNFSNLGTQCMAFFFSLAAVGLAVWLTRIVKSDALLGLVLGGILVSTLFQSGTSIVKLVADADDKLPQITFWLMGTFANITLGDFLLVIVPMLVGFAILLAMRWRLNVLSFGEEEARTLGINTSSTRLWVIVAATMITACSVSICGVIGYVGLVVPHLARAVVGPNYRVLLPTSMVIGSAFLLVVDNFSRLMFATEVPIGILTSIIGVPFFIFIYRHNLRGW